MHRLICPLACGILSSPTRDQTHIPCIARQILNHWTTREVCPLSSVSPFSTGSFPSSLNMIKLYMPPWTPNPLQPTPYLFLPHNNQHKRIVPLSLHFVTSQALLNHLWSVSALASLPAFFAKNLVYHQIQQTSFSTSYLSEALAIVSHCLSLTPHAPVAFLAPHSAGFSLLPRCSSLSLLPELSTRRHVRESPALSPAQIFLLTLSITAVPWVGFCPTTLSCPKLIC